MDIRIPAVACAVLACLSSGCSNPPARAAAAVADASEIGLDRSQAIEVCRPEGQRRYLARLVCPDRSHPPFERIGSVGLRNELPAGMSEEEQMEMMMAVLKDQPLAPGALDHHMVDAYAVRCGAATTTLYLDMYHCDAPAPTTAPQGFTFGD